ncbi:winged helix-turn-helix domain-containing protein [Streptomyces sp. CA-250714]|uniref:winged helix-turn-helix domain-containing protein n=1 Tax=Streptomyces sp. CA-250714 TaxID=3240060 RepID=UPI003D8D0F77
MKSGYPNSPAAWERGADRLHALAADLLSCAGTAAKTNRQIDHVVVALRATLRARPQPAGLQHVVVLAGQLRTLIWLLRQGSDAQLAETVARAIASGAYAPGSYLPRTGLSKDFGASPDVVRRAVVLLVDTGVLEQVGRRLRVPGPGKPYRNMPEHIAQRLRQRIASGVYRDGQALPSQQKLAKEFGSSTTSVSRAVADLRAEGLVAVSRGRPVTVINPPRPPHRRALTAPAANVAASRPVQDLPLPEPQTVPAESA